MARIRTVKPEFFTSQSTARLSMLARLTFIGMLTEADDYGRLVDSAKLLAGSLFPHDEDVTPRKMEAVLVELEGNGKIHRYEVAGDRYCEIVHWDKHQKVSHKGRTSIPTPDGEVPDGSERLAGDSPETRRRIHGGSPDSLGSSRARAGSMDHGSMEGARETPAPGGASRRTDPELRDAESRVAALRRMADTDPADLAEAEAHLAAVKAVRA